MSNRGVDVSSNNAHPINWAAMYQYLKQQGGGAEPFAIIKTTEATWYTNPDASTDVTQARQAGFKAVAAYVFDHGNVDPQAEVDYAKAHSLGLPIFDDIEDPAGLDAAQYAAHARALVAVSGQTLEYLNQSEVAEGFPADRLWLAQYDGDPNSSRYPCLMKQYTSSGAVPGCVGGFDLNAWCGTEAQFGQFFDLAPPAPVVIPGSGSFVGMAMTRDGYGYWLVESNLAVVAKGDAAGPSSPGAHLNKPLVGVCSNPGGTGFWAVGADGGVFCEEGAPMYGSLGAEPQPCPVVSMAATPDGRGYWLARADGYVKEFGNAVNQGDMRTAKMNAPIVGMAARPQGGYWLVGGDGGVFSFGGAAFKGSTGATKLSAPIVGMASTPDGNGYWLVGADGGVFTFGSAGFHGSTGSVKLNKPVVSIVPTHSGQGYYLVARDGGVFCFGDARFKGAGV